MSHPVIDTDECIGCGLCEESCPQEVISIDFARGYAVATNEDDCIACGECMEACPMGAITDIEED